MRKIIAFSLWGDDPKYHFGAIRNAELAAIHYPDWKCRFYIATTVQPIKKQLAGTSVSKLMIDTIFSLMEKPNVEICHMNEPANWHGMFWRFLPASQDSVDIFISRDCDSRLSAREAAAVNEWLKSPQLVHSMADHPYHFHPKAGLMGGMFGMKKHAFFDMKEQIAKFAADYPDAWQCDQSFLRDYIFPLVAHKIYATSDIHHGCHKFPLERTDESFVGEIIGPNEEILHPEHRELRNVK